MVLDDRRDLDLCAICLEDIASMPSVVLVCLHEFHDECVVRWLSDHPSCPVCR